MPVWCRQQSMRLIYSGLRITSHIQHSTSPIAAQGAQRIILDLNSVINNPCSSRLIISLLPLKPLTTATCADCAKTGGHFACKFLGLVLPVLPSLSCTQANMRYPRQDLRLREQGSPVLALDFSLDFHGRRHHVDAIGGTHVVLAYWGPGLLLVWLPSHREPSTV